MNNSGQEIVIQISGRVTEEKSSPEKPVVKYRWSWSRFFFYGLLYGIGAFTAMLVSGVGWTGTLGMTGAMTFLMGSMYSFVIDKENNDE